jgi:ferredoxin
MQIQVDRERCIGSGLCALKLPSVFEQDNDEGLVVLLNETGGTHTREELAATAYGCPSQAISIPEE